MTTFPGSPAVTKGRLIQFDPAGGQPPNVFTFPLNPRTLFRTVQIPLSPSGAPIQGATAQETIRFTLPLDASDRLELGQSSLVYPELAALEVLMRPPAAGSKSFLLFTWGARVIPVRLIEIKVLERLFDPSLNTLRAMARLTLVVLSESDLVENEAAAKAAASYVQSITAAAAQAFNTSK